MTVLHTPYELRGKGVVLVLGRLAGFTKIYPLIETRTIQYRLRSFNSLEEYRYL